MCGGRYRSAVCPRGARRKRAKGEAMCGELRRGQKWGLVEKGVTAGGWGGYALVEGGRADGGMACSGKSDHLWRKADAGTFSGLPDTLREGGNVDLGKKTCVPETKQKEPFSSVLHAIFLIQNDNPRKGILKRICCVWSQVKTISRQPRAFRFLCF